jgi:hypothetical protein
MADDKRMNHDVMREASERPLEGAAATDTVAASGGLEVPGQENRGNTPAQRKDRAASEREPAPTAASIDKMHGEQTNRRGER